MRCPKCETPLIPSEMARHLGGHLSEIVPDNPHKQSREFGVLSNVLYLYGWEGIVNLVLKKNSETVKKLIEDGCAP